jgi:geranylgeranyl diphosphate synthase type II
VKLIAEKAGIYGMVSGQVADTDNSKMGDPAKWLEFIHSHKTGALIAACVQIGAILADYSASNYNALTRFGEEVGKCFQIQDDILDETGNKALLGKTPGKDKKNNTFTYPKIYGLEQSYQLANQSFEQALLNLELISTDVSRLKQLAEFILKRDH